LDQYVEMKELAQQGLSKVEIGRRMGLERHTVAKYMDSGPPQARTRCRVSSLQPFQDYTAELSGWASVFGGDEVLTAAILDRLLHHGTVVNIRGQSYRLKEKLRGGILESGGPAETRTPRRQKQTSDQA
jgi:hypothetical protein